jgi:ATP-dependent RNA helicase DDX55/SPB4
MQAVTGSGKTLAFLVPIVERLSRLSAPLAANEVGAIVLAPTRELARQIGSVLDTLLASPPSLSGSLPGSSSSGSSSSTSSSSSSSSSVERRFTSLVMVGGESPEEDLRFAQERGCQIIVSTPGRMSDFMSRLEAASASASAESAAGLPSWRKLEVLVMDEADRLLGMGFQATIDEILRRLPKQRRTGLFSATQTREVKELMRAGMRNPVTVRVRVENNATAHALAGAQRIPSQLENTFVVCRQDDKLRQLVEFLEGAATESQARLETAGHGLKAVVFFLTCASVDWFSTVLPVMTKRGPEAAVEQLDKNLIEAARRMLPRSGTGRLAVKGSSAKGPTSAVEAIAVASNPALPLYALHGRMEQKKRDAALEAFRRAPSGVLLCTDVAARGIDVPDVDWIVQYDPPSDPSFFVHRIGRTARAGRSGAAMVFLLPSEKGYVELLRDVHKVPLVPREDASHVFGSTRVADEEGASKTRRNVVCRCARLLAAADRDVLEKGTKAFVSFARGYAEHDLKYVFNFEDLDIPRLAKSLGLLKLPSVKEFRGRKKQELAYRVEPDDVHLPAIEGSDPPVPDTSQVAFLDSAREAQRKKRLAAEAERSKEAAVTLGLEGSAHVKMAGKGVVAAIDKAKREAKRHAAEHQDEGIRRRKSKSTRMYEDWDELQREERLAKKLKMGKISEDEYEKLTSVVELDGDVIAEAVQEARAAVATLVAPVPSQASILARGGLSALRLSQQEQSTEAPSASSSAESRVPSGQALLKATGIAPRHPQLKSVQARAAHKASLVAKSAANLRRHQTKVARSRARHRESKAARTGKKKK